MVEIIDFIIKSPYLGITAICLSILGFLIQLIITEKYKTKVSKEINHFLEELRWDNKVREQAAKVAEYMDLARNLKNNSPEEAYHKANTLAWELAMWLPTDVYIKLGESLTKPNTENNPLQVVIEVRQLLLKEKAGDLTADDIIHHAPGIGRK